MPKKKKNSVEDQELLDENLYLGHQVKSWDPKTKSFIGGTPEGVYSIDVQKIGESLCRVGKFLHETILSGRKILFVATKEEIRDLCKTAAEETEQLYVVNRWLGGMLTNTQTIRGSVQRMEELQAFFGDEGKLKTVSEKEHSILRRELNKLERTLTGIKDMSQLPRALFVVDINRDKLAVAEAHRLNIPVIALVHTGMDPDRVEYPISGNNDSVRTLGIIFGYFVSVIIDAMAERSDSAERQGVAFDENTFKSGEVLSLEECEDEDAEGVLFTHDKDGQMRPLRLKSLTRETSEERASIETFLNEQLGETMPWQAISRAIIKTVSESSDKGFKLSEVSNLAKSINCSPDEVFSVLNLLSHPEKGLLHRRYIHIYGDVATRISQAEITQKLTEWWRDKSLSDDEWKAWASSVELSWTTKESLEGES